MGLWGSDFWYCDRSNYKLFIPVLVISGGQDSLFTEEIGSKLAGIFRYGQHFHLSEAAHLLLAESPEQVNRKILDFLAAM